MALQYISTGDGLAGFASDSATNERGAWIKILNDTGTTSVKGSLISASTSTNVAAILQSNEFDAFGVVQESGIAIGSLMRVWVNGAICQVLIVDGKGTTRGEILVCDATDGRGTTITNPGSGLPAVEIHFKECGHVLETKSSGTNVLALCMIHFN